MGILGTTGAGASSSKEMGNTVEARIASILTTVSLFRIGSSSLRVFKIPKIAEPGMAYV